MTMRYVSLWRLWMFAFLIVQSSAWEWNAEDLELFDLVEELNVNFYDLLGVDRSSASGDIRKAYRRLSLQLHPDKNKADDASEKFRQLVSVYEVLRDEQKRQRYNLVLDHGLPDWRQPVFYYRRVRKMGLLELSLLLCSILTVGQYLVVWSIYFERKFTLEENYAAKRKKDKKGKKNRGSNEDDVDEVLQEVIDSIPRPRFIDLWPFRLIRFSISMIVGVPGYIEEARVFVKCWRERKVEEAGEKEEEYEEPVKRVKRRYKMEIPELDDAGYDYKASPTSCVQNCESDRKQDDLKQLKMGDWMDEDYVLLSKAVARFPGGTQNRWENIAEMVGRPVSEVTTKAKTVKSSHVMNLDLSVQGDNPKTAKKTYDISDSIISQNFDDNEKYLIETDSSNDHLPKRRHKTKVVKSADRTLMISNVDMMQSSVKNNEEKSKVTEPKKSCDVENSNIWSQSQQMLLEKTIKLYPKGVDQRWEKIAEHIPGKSKDDCIARFRYLVDLVKKKKQEVVH